LKMGQSREVAALHQYPSESEQMHWRHTDSQSHRTASVQ
jgi:hypothetical protein